MTTNETQQGKDLAIYNEMTAAARRAFEFVEIAPDQYTAAQIERLINKERRARFADNAPEIGDAGGMISINYDGFSCSYPFQSAFEILAKIETAWQIPTAARATFEREAEEAPEMVAFEIPAEAAAVVKAVAKKDPARPGFTFAYVDTERRALVGSNSQVLNICALPSLAVAEGARAGYLVAPKLLKSGRVVIDANNNAKNGGKVCESPDFLQFPKWAAVLPEVCDTDRVSIDQTTRRALVKAVAAATKYSDTESTNFGAVQLVVITGEAYTNRLNISSRRRSASDTDKYEYFRTAVQLPETLQRSFVFAVHGPNFAAVPAFDSIYIAPNRAAVLFGSAQHLSVVFSPGVGDDYEREVKSTDERPRWAAVVDPLAEMLSAAEPQQAEPAAAEIVAEPEQQQEPEQTEPAAEIVAEQQADPISTEQEPQPEPEQQAAPFASAFAILPEIPEQPEPEQDTERADVLPLFDIDSEAGVIWWGDPSAAHTETTAAPRVGVWSWLVRAAAVLLLCLAANWMSSTQSTAGPARAVFGSIGTQNSSSAPALILPTEHTEQQAEPISSEPKATERHSKPTEPAAAAEPTNTKPEAKKAHRAKAKRPQQAQSTEAEPISTEQAPEMEADPISSSPEGDTLSTTENAPESEPEQAPEVDETSHPEPEPEQVETSTPAGVAFGPGSLPAPYSVLYPYIIACF